METGRPVVVGRMKETDHEFEDGRARRPRHRRPAGGAVRLDGHPLNRRPLDAADPHGVVADHNPAGELPELHGASHRAVGDVYRGHRGVPSQDDPQPGGAVSDGLRCVSHVDRRPSQPRPSLLPSCEESESDPGRDESCRGRESRQGDGASE